MISSNDSDILVYPGVSNVIYSVQIKGDLSAYGVKSDTTPLLPADFSIHGCLVERSSIFHARQISIPQGKSKAPSVFDINLSRDVVDELGLVALACLLKNDYCRIYGLGIATAMCAFARFCASFPRFENVHSIFPASWKPARVVDAEAAMMDGLIAFLFHPVYLISFSSAPESPRDFCVVPSTYMLADNISAVPILRYLQSSTSVVARSLRAYMDGISLSPPLRQDIALYRHFGDKEGCPQLNRDAKLQRCLAALRGSRTTPWLMAKDFLPSLEFSTADDYFKQAAGQLFCERILERGTERLDGEQIDAHVETEFDKHPDLVVIIGKIPQSQDRSTYTVRVSLSCSRHSDCPLRVDRVVDAQCECTIRMSMRCQHVAALLALHALTSQRLAKHGSLSSTGFLCSFLPGGQDTQLATQERPVVTARECRSLNFKLADILKPDFEETLKARRADIARKRQDKESKLEAKRQKFNYDFFDSAYADSVFC